MTLSWDSFQKSDHSEGAKRSTFPPLLIDE
jgi:hypothetical protein